MTSTQDVADGESRITELERKYANVPSAGCVEAARLRLLLLGLVGSGKSHFIQSIPGGRILNLAMSPITNPHYDPSVTTVWPLPGDYIRLTWPVVEERLAEWRADPECRVICVDDYAELARVSLEYAAWRQLAGKAQRSAQNAAESGQGAAKGPDLEFMDPWLVRQAHGETSYDLARNYINYEMALANQAGKGFIIPMHVDKEVVTVKDPRTKETSTFMRWAPTATFKAMKRLYSPIDACFYIYKMDREVSQKMSIAKTRVTEKFVATDFSELSEWVKPRTLIQLPARIEVTDRGWLDFEAAYNPCATGAK